MKTTKTTKENLQSLKAYTKDEIIDAIGNHFNADKLSKDILYICKQKRDCKIFAEHGKALNAEISARNEYCEWLKETCVKYGDGEKVETAKSEAIKEFAERLKEIIYTHENRVDVDGIILLTRIDNSIDTLVKEMTEGNNDRQS